MSCRGVRTFTSSNYVCISLSFCRRKIYRKQEIFHPPTPRSPCLCTREMIEKINPYLRMCVVYMWVLIQIRRSVESQKLTAFKRCGKSESKTDCGPNCAQFIRRSPHRKPLTSLREMDSKMRNPSGKYLCA